MRVALTSLESPLRSSRALQPEAVGRLADSMQRLGLRTPITVRAAKSVRNGREADVWEIVTGRHRVAAARKLGWMEIEAIATEGDETDARLWEIAENLHRADLTVAERAENIAEWVRLTVPQVGEPTIRSHGRPTDSGFSRAARELPIAGKTEKAREHNVERAVKIAGLSDEAKAAARETGRDNNQSALLAAAKVAPKEQARVIREYQPTARVKPAPDPLNDFEVEENGFAAFMRVWNVASPNLRQRIRDFIDTPVFDNTRSA